MSFPAYRSSLFTIEPSVYKTDRVNESREDISRHVADIEVDGDADRVGSKLYCNITTYRDVVNDGDWIAPYFTYSPETGESLKVQMGHFRLDPPMVEYDGTSATNVIATGVDILDLMDAATLPETFYTPPGANLIQDIRTLIQMATRGTVGPNMVLNSSFEHDAVGWVGNGAFTAGGSGTIQWSPGGSYDVPSGERTWSPTFAPAQPAGATASIEQSIPIPSHLIGQTLMLSGLWLPSHLDHRGYLDSVFYDASNVVIAGAGIRTQVGMRPALLWTREMAYGVVPENANRVVIRVVVQDAVGGGGGQRRTSWDDISLQSISGEPLPDSQLALPNEVVASGDRIQSLRDTSYLEAINIRWEAAGYQELFPMMDSRLTSRKRDSADEAAARTYSEHDSRIVDVMRIEVDPSNRYNIARFIKEDLAAGQSMAVEAVNDDPNDPWSVHGFMGQVPVTVVVQDAVDEAALLASAREHLARASDQEDLTMMTLPDPTLGLHDLISVDSQNRTAGTRAIRSIRWGMTFADPLVQIVARRTIRGGA